MKITRERKIIGAVLVIALAGLGYEQLGGSPSDSDASAETGSLLLASNVSSNNPALLSATGNDGASLASRLTTISQKSGTTSPESIRDVFLPHESWIERPKQAEAKAEPAPRITAADKFVVDHKLSAISMNGSGASVAVVDGKLLHLGAAIDGFKLVGIDRQSVTFKSTDGERATLTLASESMAAGR